MQNTLSRHLEKIKQNAQNPTEQGTLFEEIVKLYLEKDSAQGYDKVWRYKEWAKEKNLTANDTGIDLIARHGGSKEIYAVQCKFYDKNTRLKKETLDSFLGKVGNPDIDGIIIADTTLPEFSNNLKDALNETRKGWHRITLADLDDSDIDWNEHIKSSVGEFKRPAKPKKPRPHQEEAIKAVKEHFETEATRGQLIMACGTGKTFTALRIAEDMAGAGKIVLYMVPSLALMSQTVKAWKYDARHDFRAFSVCSDSNVGKHNDDTLQLPIHELSFPATTKATTIADQVRNAPRDQMIVVFSTYQSIDVLARAQKKKNPLPDFDLIICDEAHRTTGATPPGTNKKESHFVRIHKDEHVAGKKRLYMTATPKIFGAKARATADENNIVIATMDDEETFGKEIHRLDFAKAVRKDLLTDYKVVVLAMDENLISPTLQKRLATPSLIKVDDITKIVGCYKALTKNKAEEEDDYSEFSDQNPMKRAVAFCQNIDISEAIALKFDDIVDGYLKSEKKKPTTHARLRIEAEHVDGTFSGKERTRLIKWLDEELTEEDTYEETCRILSNVRCLSEGVDVPSLDAIIFMHPRKSQIEVVQSVGRVMRKAEGKQMGYVILPVVIRQGADPAVALNNDDSYKVVWQILNALRTHDSRFNAIINQIRLGQDVSDKIEILNVSRDVGGGESTAETVDISKASEKQTEFKFDEFHEAILAKILKNCGTSKYWDNWTDKVLGIAKFYIREITNIIDSEGPEKNAFNAFLDKIKTDLNDSITQENAIEMLAQHMITKPVFDTLFKDNKFTKNNSVSKAMEVVLEKLNQHDLDKTTDELEGFYESVEEDARGLDNAQGRQDLVKRLYEQFFYKAFPDLTKRLGIVYTPTEIVDFIIHSVNDVLKSEFKTTLGEKDVHIIDPFTGTGTFITRLLQSGLITPEELEHKYKNEIHANELVLLAYYIAAINIESVYHDLMAETQGTEPPYTPFDGIVLTDTFQMREIGAGLSAQLLDDNSEKRKKQRELDIQVIMGNPPYSAKQQNENDNAPNIKYPNLDEAIRDSYVRNSVASNTAALYDSYIRAFRWASDRLKEKGDNRGVIAYVSNASWVDSASTDGLRKCLVEEFSSLYIFHLRGNIRRNMMSKVGLGEGGNVFGSGSMTGIAISVLVRNPDAKEQGKIYFRNIGDDLKTDEKLALIKDFKSIDGITSSEEGWGEIQPDKHYDWINQGDPSFENYISIGNKKEKAAATIFENYSSGLKTQRDAWCYNSSRKTVENNIKRMIDFYDEEVGRFTTDRGNLSVDSFVNSDPTKISWSAALKENLKKGVSTLFVPESMVKAHYRPFQKRWLYFDRFFNERFYQIHKIFPVAERNNLVITTCGVSAGNFSCLLSDTLPDLNLMEAGAQCFPLKLYDPPTFEVGLSNTGTADYTVRDGITNEGLKHFQKRYPKEKIKKEDLFFYIYGLLHSNDYRERFKNNLSKELPRIPAVKTATDFWAFSKAGRELGGLHIHYENAKLHRLDIKEGDLDLASIEDPAKFYRVEKMKFGKGKDKSIVHYNNNITITNIPPEAYDYIVNGRAALEWVMDRQGVKTDKNSGIVNDANDYANETKGDPAYPLELFQRVLTVSLETMEIVKNLPKLTIN